MYALKLDFNNGDIRRISKPSTSLGTASALRDVVNSFNLTSPDNNFIMFWIDEEGDRITIGSDSDVQAMRDVNPKGVKVYIQDGLKRTGEAAGSSNITSTVTSLVSTPKPSSKSSHNKGATTPPIESDFIVVDNISVHESKNEVIKKEAPASVSAVPEISKETQPTATPQTPNSISATLDLLLGMLKLEELKPLVDSFLTSHLGEDEASTYLRDMFTSDELLQILNKFKTSGVPEKLQPLLTSIPPMHFFLFLDASSPINEELLHELNAGLFKPILDSFPKLKEFFPIISLLEHFIETSKDNKSDDAVEVHLRITCDGCGLSPIRGIRYKCDTCEDFDFCSDCRFNNTHDPSHPFKSIEKPVYKNRRCVGGVPPCGIQSPFFPGFGGINHFSPFLPFLQGMMPSPYGVPLSYGGSSPDIRSAFGGGHCPLGGSWRGGCCPTASSDSKKKEVNTSTTHSSSSNTTTTEEKRTVLTEKEREAKRNEDALLAAINASLNSLPPVDDHTTTTTGAEESKSSEVVVERKVATAAILRSKKEKYVSQLDVLKQMGFDDVESLIYLLDEKDGNLRMVVETLFMS